MGSCCSSQKQNLDFFKIISPPVISSTISNKKVEEILRKTYPSISKLILNSTEYSVYSSSELDRFIQNEYVQDYLYRSEANDCDNYAKMLVGLHSLWTYTLPTDVAFGFISGDLRDHTQTSKPNYHAKNLVITTDDNGLTFEVKSIEPQNDNITNPINNAVVWNIIM